MSEEPKNPSKGKGAGFENSGFAKKLKRFGFDFKHLRGDIFGGLTAGIVALPLALAFGLQSGLGAASGLYGAIIIGFLAESSTITPA